MKIELEFIPTGNFRKFLVSLAVLLTMGAVFFSTLAFLNNGENAVRGATLAGIELNGLSRTEAHNTLNSAIEDFYNSELVIQTEEGQSVQASPRTLGISINATSSLNKAYKYGKQGNFFVRMGQQARALLGGKQISASVTIDAKKLATFIEHTMDEIHRPAQNASFVYNTEKDAFEPVPAQTGTIIDTNIFMDKVARRASEFSKEPIMVVQHKDEPLVTEPGNKALAEAEAILAKMPYTITTKENSWEVEKEDLISWIKFEPVLDKSSQKYVLSAELSIKEISDYLTGFAPGLSKSPQNAQFSLENGLVTAFQLGEKGQELDVNKSTSVLAENIKNGTTTTNLAFIETEPEITNESVDNLEIDSLLARGTTNFAGSPNSRVHNIGVGADKYHGMLVPPGEEFSFNENLGPVNASTGYLPELVIKQNKTVPEYGGGLCQVSTTLFQAAAKAGMEITERRNHSFPVVYYGTPGFDATIYPPNPDFAFVNNTDNHILIQRRIVGTKLSFEIYGKNTGRTVEIDGPHPYDRKPDGSVKAWLKQTVRDKDGNIIEEQTFYSNYKSPNLYPVQRNPLE